MGIPVNYDRDPNEPELILDSAVEIERAKGDVRSNWAVAVMVIAITAICVAGWLVDKWIDAAY